MKHKIKVVQDGLPKLKVKVTRSSAVHSAAKAAITDLDFELPVGGRTTVVIVIERLK